MKIKSVAFSLCLLSVSTFCCAEDSRYFSWFQQETVGDAIVLQVFEKGKESEVSVHSEKTSEKKFKIQNEEFEKLFAILESEDLSKYKVSSSLPGPAGDPKYYSVKFSSSAGEETVLRLPRTELNGSATEFVNGMKILISK